MQCDRRASGRRALAFAGLCWVVMIWWMAAPAQSQLYGRWSWDAILRLGETAYENSLSGVTSGTFDQKNLILGLGLNGFIVDPAIAKFRLAADLDLIQYEDGVVLDSNRWGVRGDIQGLSTGAWPFRLYLARQSYQYVVDGGEGPITFGLADSATSWGGRLRLRRGLVRGLYLGLDHSTTDFVDPLLSTETDNREFVEWSRGTGSFQHLWRVEHRLRELAVQNASYDDMRLTIDESGKLPWQWDWRFFGVGLQRETELGGNALDSEDYRIRNRLSRPFRGNDLLTANIELGTSKAGSATSTDRASFALNYRWKLTSSVDITPYGQYLRQQQGDATIEAPRLGINVSWAPHAEQWDIRLSALVASGEVNADSDRGAISSTESSYGAFAVVGWTSAGGYRAKLDGEYLKNDFETSSDLLPDLPDLGLGVSRIGAVDSSRARLTLEHLGAGWRTSIWAEWRLRESQGTALTGGFSADTRTLTVDLQGPRFSVLINGTDSLASQTGFEEQQIRSLGASLTWRPTRSLQVFGTYRRDERDVLLLASIEGERWETGATFQLGRLAASGRYFSMTETVGSGRERENSGFEWTLSRRFAGWLPIVTGTQRRGFVR